MHRTDNGLNLPPTAMNEMETLSLERAARDMDVLELGAEYGYSTIVMARVARSVVSVDWHNGYNDNPTIGPSNNDTLWQYVYNIKEVRNNVVPMVGRFQDVLPLLADASFDFIFLDGGHDFDGAKFCFEQARRLLRPLGTFACHDYGVDLCNERPVAEFFKLTPRSPVVGSLAIFDDYGWQRTDKPLARGVKHLVPETAA
jgi:SAM-dependent methyltransferase